MTDCLPYHPPVALTSTEAQLLNQIVGRYALATDIARQTQVRAFVITWAPAQTLTQPGIALGIAGQACMVSLSSVSSWPQVQEVLQNVPWSALDSDLQLATLEVAFEELLKLLDCSQLELVASPWSTSLPESALSALSAHGVEKAWTFRVQIEWISGATAELSVAFRTDSLAWLASHLNQLRRQSTTDLGRLRVDADVVCGTTELSLADIQQLGAGDLVLFSACQTHLNFRQITLSVPGQLRESEFQPAASPQPTSLEVPVAISTSHIPLTIVAGVVTCTLAEALHLDASIPMPEPVAGQFRLQHGARVIAQGDCGSLLNRPAFIVAG